MPSELWHSSSPRYDFLSDSCASSDFAILHSIDPQTTIPYLLNDEIEHEALSLTGTEFNYVFLNAPSDTSRIDLGIFNTAVQNSSLWNEERVLGAWRTDCISAVVPADHTQEILIAIRVSRQYGYIVISKLGFQVSQQSGDSQSKQEAFLSAHVLANIFCYSNRDRVYECIGRQAVAVGRYAQPGYSTQLTVATGPRQNADQVHIWISPQVRRTGHDIHHSNQSRIWIPSY